MCTYLHTNFYNIKSNFKTYNIYYVFGSHAMGKRKYLILLYIYVQYKHILMRGVYNIFKYLFCIIWSTNNNNKDKIKNLITLNPELFSITYFYYFYTKCMH
jgi:hypothetical protein